MQANITDKFLLIDVTVNLHGFVVEFHCLLLLFVLQIREVLQGEVNYISWLISDHFNSKTFQYLPQPLWDLDISIATHCAGELTLKRLTWSQLKIKRALMAFQKSDNLLPKLWLFIPTWFYYLLNYQVNQHLSYEVFNRWLTWRWLRLKVNVKIDEKNVMINWDRYFLWGTGFVYHSQKFQDLHSLPATQTEAWEKSTEVNC